MYQIELEASKREILGKKVRFLRRKGITPVNLFGHGIESRALQCDTEKLKQVLTEAGETVLINLKVGREKTARPVVIRDVQVNSLKGVLLHVDFYQVKMGEEIKVEVPISLVGKAPALEVMRNTLLQEMDTLTVECLPSRIPASIELDISSLTKSEQVLRVKDIELEEGVTVINDPEQVVAKISSQQVQELVEEKEITEEALKATKETTPPVE